MQDNPAPGSPRIFQPRDCADCPASFVPVSSQQTRCPACRDAHAATVARETHLRKLAKRKADRAAARLAGPVCSYGDCKAPLRRNNTLGRCQEHRYIGEGMGECAHCGKPIRRDNQVGYCEEHKYPTSRAPARFCASSEGCDQQLRVDNTCGYCPQHFGESPLMRAYKDRRNAKAREETRLRPDERRECSEGGCTNRLRSDNIIGRCSEHYYLPLDLAECEVDGCPNRLMTANTIGRCNEHRGEYWAPGRPRCEAEGCERTLQADNMIGYCRKHRALSPTRKAYNRKYYRLHADDLKEYAKLYRQVYAEEHRAYTLLHYAVYGRITPEAQRAAAARRRMKATHGMDSVDIYMSVVFRMVIKDLPCFYCGATETHHVDHFFPIDKGGTDVWWNLRRSCQTCNLRKHTACGTAFLLRAGRLTLT